MFTLPRRGYGRKEMEKMNISGFITNLGKYNEGQLVGEWIDFPIADKELKDVLQRIGINEQYEEYFFTDWDSELDLYPVLGEYPRIAYVNEMAEKVEAFDDDDLLLAATELWNLDEILENGPNAYWLAADINTDEELGYYWVEDSGCYDVKELGFLTNYIDYEALGRDIRLEANGGFTSYGWVEYMG